MIRMGLLYSNYEANPVTNNSLNINAVSGTLTKTYKDSYFTRFSKNSICEHFYFREKKPSRIIDKSDCINASEYNNYERYNFVYYNLKEIVILQVMLCSNDDFLVEAIDKEDYHKMLGITERKESE